MKFSKTNLLVDIKHRFHSIEEEHCMELVEMLTVIVRRAEFIEAFFASAKYSLKVDK